MRFDEIDITREIKNHLINILLPGSVTMYISNGYINVIGHCSLTSKHEITKLPVKFNKIDSLFVKKLYVISFYPSKNTGHDDVIHKVETTSILNKYIGEGHKGVLACDVDRFKWNARK